MSKARDIASAPIAPSTVSATELGYVDGVTSAIQTQLDAKTAKATLTTTGDIYYASAANTPARLGIGSTDQVLKVTAGIPAWATAAAGGMTLLSTTTLSGTSTTISSINQTYKDLFVIVTGVTNTTPDGYRYIRPNNTSGIAIQSITGQPSDIFLETDIYIPRDGDTKFTDSDNAASVIIYNYASSATNKPFNGSVGYTRSASAVRAQVFGGSIKTNTAISSLVFVQTGGGSFNAGTVKIYGVN
jgi:hypothetical protein